jgi:CubicO group peptidase (beta-lactamase class C family)
MKRFFRYFLIVLLVLIISLLTYLSITFPPIMSGMAAKTMCSCVFVLGRTPESVRQKELSVFPGLSSAAIDIADSSSVTAQVWWSTRKAIYRKGLGCTLLAERSEEEVRNQKINLPPRIEKDSSNELLVTINPAIAAVIDDAFREPNLEKPRNTLALLVIHNGKIVGERYAEGFDHDSRFMGWSMTKSITNALVGILVKDGKLNLDQPAPVAEWQNDERRQITLNDLMHASSGLEWSESYFKPGDFHNMFIHSDDKAAYAASKKLEFKPGEFFEYSSGTTNILSRIVRQAVGDVDYYRFPYERLFRKTGMDNAIIEPDASGTFVGSSYGYASARDWGRFGLLFLNDGVVNGERILPEGWVKYSTTPTTSAPIGQYGAQWWLNAGAKSDAKKCYHPGLPSDEFGAEGFEDQFVFIIPSQKLVVVRLGISHHGTDIEKIVGSIIQALSIGP